MNLKRVVITGMGAVTPLGNNVSDYWEALKQGKSGAGRISYFDPEKFRAQIACEVKGFDARDYMDRREAGRSDRVTHYSVAVSHEAVKDSGLDLEKVNKERAGIILASGIGGLNTFSQEIIDYAQGDGTPRFSPFFLLKTIVNTSAGQISLEFGFKGPNYSVVSACASSNHALIDAFNLIRLGKADVMIAGGAEAAITPACIGGFSAMKATSTRNDDPQAASRPFDADRDGFVAGEGAGVFVLETLEHALDRGARIYAELVGGGMAADAHHLVASHPEGDGLYRAMKSALEESGLQAVDIDYINAHATSTPVGDPSEISSIVRLFGEKPDHLHVSSTKSMTGHAFGAAGIIEAVATVKAIENGVIPPTINLHKVDEKVGPDINLTPNVAVEKPVKAAICNTSGFGGQHASTLFKAFEE